ncbi:neutral zinc metallopeptidase [Amycolatopsis anabasis]|uniref:neutral zinc metallopeptidase n=1 Tax=Amycolatopsis anabasis TaxID=1840409 RepID=UPI00131E79A8|nr:neutral zinc metallopeptidase [Amycolatopsis anabasis]
MCRRPPVPLLVLLALALTACGAPVPGRAGPSSTIVGDAIRLSTSSLVDSGFVHGGDGGEIDKLAATAITDIQAYWTQAFPRTFGAPWQELRGGFFSADTADAGGQPPPCSKSTAAIAGNAYYCPSGDLIVWDRAALIPVLTERFGAGAVMLVLAHETGHAVQQRTGVTGGGERRRPDLYPGVVIESMADCYAGSFIRWVVDGHAEHLKLQRGELDSALRALITFRDPVGTPNTDNRAHGDAFDRVSAFQDGYDQGPELCSKITAENREFTQRAFGDAEDEARGGNLPLPDLISAMSGDLAEHFTLELSNLGKQWTPPRIEAAVPDPLCTSGKQGAASYCPVANAVQTTGPVLPELHASIGDFGSGTELATRYALGVLHALERPLAGEETRRQILCLAGAYTGSLLKPQREFALSPGDLDEAVQALLAYDDPARDTEGGSIPSGFDRVSAFRTGVTGADPACGLS